MPDDDDEWYDETEGLQTELLQAELRSVYAQLEHVSAIATALACGLRGLLDALDVPSRPGLATQIRRAHWRLALREARDAMRQASDHLEEGRHGQT